MKLKMTEKLKTVQKILEPCADEVFHYWTDAKKSNRYILWQEKSEADSIEVDNHKTDQILNIDIDLYVLDEFDEAIDDIQDALDKNSLSWSYEGSDYELEAGLIHHSWRIQI